MRLNIVVKILGIIIHSGNLELSTMKYVFWESALIVVKIHLEWLISIKSGYPILGGRQWECGRLYVYPVSNGG